MNTELLENRKVTPQMHLLVLAKPPAFEHTIGQYIHVRQNGNEAIFTVLSHPENGRIELLVKNSGKEAGRLCKTPPGEEIEITSGDGPGFDMESLKEKTVYLLSHGSGISAVFPILEEIRKDRNTYGPVRFIYGARTHEDFPFQETLRDWMGSVEYYDIISQDPKDPALWNGEIGHVQDVLKRIQPEPAGAVALLSGSKEFEKDVEEILSSFGFEKTQILKNH